MICSQCQCHLQSDSPALSYLGEPLCHECSMAEREDGTDEALVEAWARENAQPGHIYYVRLGDYCVFEVAPGDGRDWTAAATDHVPCDVLLDNLPRLYIPDGESGESEDLR